MIHFLRPIVRRFCRTILRIYHSYPREVDELGISFNSRTRRSELISNMLNRAVLSDVMELTKQARLLRNVHTLLLLLRVFGKLLAEGEDKGE